MSHIRVSDLTLSYGDTVAVEKLGLEIAEGEALVLLGQSGCGKTSTMRCIAGLETPDTGTITVGDQTLFDSDRGIDRPSHKRNIGMVFQSYAIWPHMTVFENVAFSLQMKRTSRSEIKRKVHETLEIVGLEGFADRGASMLSGGQMQRVALARSLVMAPSVMLLDEPLSNLDARLRQRLRGDLRELQSRLGLTSIYVTHDQEEALALADRIAMMQFGRIVQIGTPNEIYSRPLSASIADFLGVTNSLPVTAVDSNTVQLVGSDQRLRVERYEHSGSLRACIRAEDIVIGETAAAATENVLVGEIVTREFQGATAAYRVRIEGGAELHILGSKHQLVEREAGSGTPVGIAAGAIQVLPLDVEGVDTAVAGDFVPESTAALGVSRS
ncbi:ABC transporter ATP-binding protein [Paramicrobacterium chengjingii]|uniref:ABC transporter ATP-binding protein n=1 Tax=Paramicrobacterium chengjingii TaxID=2769067 RepID=A0ABX6YH04_9MICO|nr:ABC transporter ATP-binding protein [Microbacterium chengjingii]QPZ38037.1 ABC transporter ATP-binding protein [Microbacterium chengjingii]